MKFQIKKEKLLKSLTLIQGVVEKKKTLPILANVLLEAHGNILTITATDLEIGIKIKNEAEINKEGKITVSAKKLFEITKELSDSIIKIETKDNNWIEIKSGNAKFNIVALTSEEYPTINDADIKDDIKISCSLLKDIIDKTFYSISTDETKYNLNGLYLHKYNGENINIRFVSTDGHRLSLYQTELTNIDKDIDFEKGKILPRKGLIELKKIIEESEEEIIVNFINNNAIFSTPNISLVMRIIDGSFPDYNRVIPDNLENYAIINTKNFLHTLKRISILANEKSKGINIKIEKDTMEISSSNPEYGEASDHLDIVYNGDDINIGFNSKYLLDALLSINSENIYFYINNNKSPCLIVPEKEEQYQAVIMPMNI